MALITWTAEQYGTNVGFANAQLQISAWPLVAYRF